MSVLIQHGVIGGDGAGRLRPKQFANRAEAASMLDRTIHLNK
jgi:hypothetical protein